MLTPAQRIRLRRKPSPPKLCAHCGEPLVAQRVMKYDAFWLTLLILLAAALSFYLVGGPILLVALALWSQKTVRWVCPQHAGE